MKSPDHHHVLFPVECYIQSLIIFVISQKNNDQLV